MIEANDLQALLYDLPAIVAYRRRHMHLSMREAAAIIGIAQSTLCNLEGSANIDTKTLIAVLRWLDT